MRSTYSKISNRAKKDAEDIEIFWGAGERKNKFCENAKGKN